MKTSEIKARRLRLIKFRLIVLGIVMEREAMENFETEE